MVYSCILVCNNNKKKPTALFDEDEDEIKDWILTFSDIYYNDVETELEIDNRFS